MKGFIIVLIACLTLSGKAQDSVLVFNQLTTHPGVPTNVPACFAIDSALYVIGGSDSDGHFLNQVWKYHVPSNSWTRMVDFPQGGIAAAGAFVLNDKGYVCCGIPEAGPAYRTVWQYTPDSDSWIQKHDYTGYSLQPDAYFTFDGKGYIGLGWPGPGNDLWQYNDTLDQWSALDTMPAPGRIASSFAVSDSFVYCFGGNFRYAYESCHETWRFDLISHVWTQLQDIPGSNRTYGATWAIGNSIICALGTHADSTGAELHKDKYIYNVQTGLWKPMTFQGFHDSISVGFSFMLGNTGYYFGGVTQLKPYLRYTNELYSFDATPLLSTGIAESKTDIALSVYPNPVSTQSTLTIATPEDGEISFSNSLGQLLYTTAVHSGKNIISCKEFHTTDGLIIYSAHLRNSTTNGKVVIVK